VRSPVNAHWYARTDAPMSWTGAETFARVIGGHLVTVRSQAESDWLEQNLLNGLAVGRGALARTVPGHERPELLGAGRRLEVDER
jgi:hypothetical protein